MRLRDQCGGRRSDQLPAGISVQESGRMKYFHLIWKNITRKKARATFTFFSVIIAFTLYGMLTALAGLFNGEMRFSADDRLFITAKNGGFLPKIGRAHV